MVAETSVDPPEESVERSRRLRRERFQARYWLWRRSKIEHVRGCGRAAIGTPTVEVSIDRDGNRHAGLSGVMQCGSIHVCPVCSAKIHHRRGLVIDKLLQFMKFVFGVTLVHATFTVRHSRRQSLREVWDAVAGAWGKASGGPAWQADQDEYGIALKLGKREVRLRIPFIRVIEVTWGPKNGWHVHVHSVLFLKGGVEQDQVNELVGGMWQRWNKYVIDQGFESGLEQVRDPNTGEMRQVGWVAKIVKGDHQRVLGDYFSKAVYELTGARFKHARGENLTPMGMLAAITELRQVGKGTSKEYRRLVAAWHEYELASHRRQVYGISSGLMDLAGLTGQWRSDKDLVEAEEPDREIIEVHLVGESLDKTTSSVPYRLAWDAVWQRQCVAELLAAFEESAMSGLAFIAGLPPAEERKKRWVDRHSPPDIPPRRSHLRRLYQAAVDPRPERYYQGCALPPDLAAARDAELKAYADELAGLGRYLRARDWWARNRRSEEIRRAREREPKLFD